MGKWTSATHRNVCSERAPDRQPTSPMWKAVELSGAQVGSFKRVQPQIIQHDLFGLYNLKMENAFKDGHVDRETDDQLYGNLRCQYVLAKQFLIGKTRVLEYT